MIIYAITNLVNGKRYVGLTSKTLAKRFAGHRADAKMGSTCALHAAMRKHGADNFAAAELVELVPGMGFDELRELERIVIAQEGTFSHANGYNRNAGGDGPPPGTPSPKRGKPLSDEHRAKLSAAWAQNPARKAEQVERNKRPMSDESRAKISASNSEPHRVEMLRARNAVMNKSPEHGAKISAAWTPERRAAASIRMQATMKRRFANG